MAISSKAQYKDRFVKELLGGVTIVETKVYALVRKDWSEILYRRIIPQETKAVNIRLIPYYAWNNRGDSEMMVWIPLK